MQPVNITKEAQKEILDIIKNKNIPLGYGLRIGVKGGRGCAGVNYLLGFDQKKEDDIAYNVEEIEVFVSKREVMFLMGLEVDFYEGADARGFTFVNTNIPASS
ncbi:MAG: iron-sulfur cluster assembly accessory protein [bacterium]|nr:iron-sulfur cluster assembly accessory protein [bacterium]